MRLKPGPKLAGFMRRRDTLLFLVGSARLVSG